MNEIISLYNSLARLLEGDGICVAVTSVNGQIFVGFNFNRNYTYGYNDKHVDAVLKFISNGSTKADDLKDFLIKRWLIADNGNNLGLRQEDLPNNKIWKSKKFKDLVNSITLSLEPIKECDKLCTIQNIYSNFGRNDITCQDGKIINSLSRIARIAQDLKKFCVEDSENLKNIKNSISANQVIYVKPIQNMHAEMSLIKYLFGDIGNKINNYKDKTISIGISKLCCLKCKASIDTINDINKNLIKDSLLIDVRGTHLTIPDSWIGPKFLYEGEYNVIYQEKENLFIEELKRSDVYRSMGGSDTDYYSSTNRSFKEQSISEILSNLKNRFNNKNLDSMAEILKWLAKDGHQEELQSLIKIHKQELEKLKDLELGNKKTNWQTIINKKESGNEKTNKDLLEITDDLYDNDEFIDFIINLTGEE